MKPAHRPRRRTVALLLPALFLALSPTTTPALAVAPSTPPAPGSPTTWVATENALPGDDGWNVAPADYADDDSLVGYATHSSVLPGEPVTLRINNTLTASETVRAYRLGWYGGTGGRLVASTGELPAQAQPRVERTADNPMGVSFAATDEAGRTVNTVDASGWKDTTSLDTTGWPEGAYLLVVDAGNQKRSQIPVIVRSAHVRGRTVMVSAPATWQAYNMWGGHSAYRGLCADATISADCRSRVVSFERPLDQFGGVDHFMVMERAGIVEAERTGVDLAYTTNVDLAQDGAQALQGARALIGLGHDEYWSNAQRDVVTALRDSGTNLVFAGGNTYWWRVRYRQGEDGRANAMEIWKSATEDPVKDPSQAAVNFNEASMVPLLGARYSCYNVNAPLTVTTPGFFLFAGTSARAGSQYPGLLREEVDSAVNSPNEPATAQIAAHSPYSCPSAKVDRAADLTYYTVRSGAGVVDLSSMGFVMAMDPLHYARHPYPDETIAFATTVFHNAVVEASAGPLAARHPSVPNVSTVLPKPVVAPPPPVNNPSDPGFPMTSAATKATTKGTGAVGDLTGDRLADLLSVGAANGVLSLSTTGPGPSLRSTTAVGSTWTGMDWISVVPDLDADGWPELLARRFDGTMWLYRGLGKGAWARPTQVGRGWGAITSLSVTPDISGDHRPDLLARSADGHLLRYAITGAASTLGSGVVVGQNWQAMTAIVAVDDLSGDHRPDVMAIRSDGRLFLYTVAGGRLTSLGEKGHGWQGFRQVVCPGDMDGDGRWDLVGLRGDGNAYEYRNLGSSWGSARLLTTTWAGVRLLA